ncbi:uncharacterized protein LOC129235684 [Anastrepha obliqua]|uniref:uncharacterized protein LOC129235684 n=1 Tax=Anastrepha obliqua TaxID=95512 RepID=UPI002408F6C4|nr:uncharacterized protein LOC129235684 [Anastrepha obliqua]
MDQVNVLTEIQTHLLCELTKLKEKAHGLRPETLSQGSIKDEGVCVDEIPYVTSATFDSFEDLYFTFKGFLYDSMPACSTASPVALNSTFVAPSHRNDTFYSDAKLPKISVPNFSGDYLEWFSFRDLYTSLVHNNSALSKIQKMYYLKNCVTGEAARLIKHIFATEANYDLAWKTLEDRFHNKRAIVDTWLKKLFAIPKCIVASHSAIRTLLDTTKECIASLTNLNVSTTNWDPLIVHLTIQKLDSETRKDWEKSLQASRELPTLEQLIRFLETCFRTLETLNVDNTQKLKSANIPQRQLVRNFNITNSSKSENSISCLCCKKSHRLFKCWVFRAYTPTERKQFVTRNSLCRNCLFPGHSASDCTSNHTCSVCNRKHHTLLHEVFSDSQPAESVTPSRTKQIQGLHVTAPFSSQECKREVLLATIILKIDTPNGAVSARALLDQGSQGTFVTEQFIQLYKLPCRSTSLQVRGVNTQQKNCVKKLAYLKLYSCVEYDYTLHAKAYVLPKFRSYLPQQSFIPLQLSSDISNIPLADPEYFKSRSIDLILGADVYGFLMKDAQIKTDSGLIYQNTHFGWVISGPMSTSVNIETINTHLCHIDDQLKRFWEQEELPNIRPQSAEDIATEQHFISTHLRDNTGRYIVSLPFRAELNGKPVPEFHNSHLGGLIRLKNMERVFARNPNFQIAYLKFMREYQDLGHMELVGEYPKNLTPLSYYLPHHGVEKLSSTTTKLRVVFDGSSIK